MSKKADALRRHADEKIRIMNQKRGIKTLRTILERMRWDDQDGYPGYYGKGQWGFESTSLPQTTPEELNDLFAMVEIVPDKIKPLGECRDCIYSCGGHERGYVRPCLDCKRPKMSHFVKGKGEE